MWAGIRCLNVALLMLVTLPAPAQMGGKLGFMSKRTGFFVLTSTSYNGNLGGLAGADAKCLTELTSLDWKGKTRAILDSQHVKAFLCATNNCSSPRPFTSYYFATAGSTTSGGGLMITDENSKGPSNNENWGAVDKFNVTGGRYWAGRASVDGTQYDTLASSFNCADWLSNSLVVPGATGLPSTTTGSRWFDASNTPCNESHRLICLVHP